jgi:hypothetical protein
MFSKQFICNLSYLSGLANTNLFSNQKQLPLPLLNQQPTEFFSALEKCKSGVTGKYKVVLQKYFYLKL